AGGVSAVAGRSATTAVLAWPGTTRPAAARAHRRGQGRDQLRWRGLIDSIERLIGQGSVTSSVVVNWPSPRIAPGTGPAGACRPRCRPLSPLARRTGF